MRDAARAQRAGHGARRAHSAPYEIVCFAVVLQTENQVHAAGIALGVLAQDLEERAGGIGGGDTVRQGDGRLHGDTIRRPAAREDRRQQIADRVRALLHAATIHRSGESAGLQCTSGMSRSGHSWQQEPRRALKMRESHGFRAVGAAMDGEMVPQWGVRSRDAAM